MYQLKNLDDTIAAISTPAGQGGIGIIRLSGKEALSITDQIFMAKNKMKSSSFKNLSVHYGWVVKKMNNGQHEIIDEALLTVMRGPKSYTKEDVVEISCHGSAVSLRTILDLTLVHGARLAEGGEFTKRAFLNGRIDLTQAEAVLDIIQSKTNAFLKVSTNQLKGELSIELESIREQLMKGYVEIEAIVNFPDDGIDSKARIALEKDIMAAEKRVNTLLASSEHGKLLRDGVKIVLCGKPNVGKSSLLNVLLKQPRAIVSEIAGTTRDTIEETMQIRGIPFQLIDTAGILEPRDLIEKEAIKRSHMSIKGADLVLLIFDLSAPLSQEDEHLIEAVKDQNVLIVFNKCDLPVKLKEQGVKVMFPDAVSIRISVLKKIAIEDLEAAIVDHVWHGTRIDTSGVLVNNLRHIDALRNCQMCLKKVYQMNKEGLSLEFISEEIKTAVNYLDSITGRNIDSDLLESIFSQFCIGK